MLSADSSKTKRFRVESDRPICGRTWPAAGARQCSFNDRGLAVAVAAKSITSPEGNEIRVVHVASGKVIFRKGDAAHPGSSATGR